MIKSGASERALCPSNAKKVIFTDKKSTGEINEQTNRKIKRACAATFLTSTLNLSELEVPPRV